MNITSIAIEQDNRMTSRIYFGGVILIVCASLVVAGDDCFWVSADPAQSFLTAKRIDDALRSETELAVADHPLEDVLKYLQERHHVTIWIDKARLQDEGVNTDQPVTLTVFGVRLETVLSLLLEPIGLTFVIEDEVIKITTQVTASEKLSTRVYPVRDLVDIGNNTDDYESLINAIQRTTGHKWMDYDQEGGEMAVVESTGSLVISQNQKAHRQIAGLLGALRRSKRLQGLDSFPITPDDPYRLNPIEPGASRATGVLPTNRPVSAWQQPRIHSAE